MPFTTCPALLFDSTAEMPAFRANVRRDTTASDGRLAEGFKRIDHL